MKILRTPDKCFEEIADFPFAPHYCEINDGDDHNQDSSLRIHYLDEAGERNTTVVLLHGEPSWSYLYRQMIPTLKTAGLRTVVPDLVGFGRSDKPSSTQDYPSVSD